MALKLPRLPGTLRIVDGAGRPSPEFQIWWQRFAENIEKEVGALVAAQMAKEAAETASAAAEAAQEAADIAQQSVDGVSALTTLQGSTVSGLTLTADDFSGAGRIQISAHTRNYADGSSVPVDAGTITGLPYSTDYWIAYDDAARTGGAVTYQAFTTPQGNGAGNVNRHFVGAVRTPASAAPPNTGNPVLPPGVNWP